MMGGCYTEYRVLITEPNRELSAHYFQTEEIARALYRAAAIRDFPAVIQKIEKGRWVNCA